MSDRQLVCLPVSAFLAISEVAPFSAGGALLCCPLLLALVVTVQCQRLSTTEDVACMTDSSKVRTLRLRMPSPRGHRVVQLLVGVRSVLGHARSKAEPVSLPDGPGAPAAGDFPLPVHEHVTRATHPTATN